MSHLGRGRHRLTVRADAEFRGECAGLVSHAYRDDYDVAFLACGDGDYMPVVEEIKRAGKRVVVVFFNEKYGLNLDLRIAADRYIDIGDQLLRSSKGTHTDREAAERRLARQQAKAAERASAAKSK